MAPLGMRNVCTPAEALQTSQGRNRFAQSMRRLKLGTWNVRSMVDAEGSVEVASQWADGQRGEERKVDVICSVCGRNFVWPGDLKRHKCLQERQKPVKDQQGAVQCGVCQRWFRSAGGLAVHRRTHNPQPS